MQIRKELEKEVIPGCIEYLSTTNPNASTRITWTGFAMIWHQEKDVVVLLGHCQYEEGEEYADPVGNYVESMTAAQAQQMSDVFKILIPFDFAQSASKNDIFSYLMNEAAKVKEMLKQMDDESGEIVETEEDDIYNDANLDEEDIALAKLLNEKTKDILQ